MLLGTGDALSGVGGRPGRLAQRKHSVAGSPLAWLGTLTPVCNGLLSSWIDWQPECRLMLGFTRSTT